MVAGSETYSAYTMAAVIPNVSRISSRIIRVLGCNPGAMTLQGTNTYLIGTGKRRILLDTGDSDVPQYINHLRTVLSNEQIDLAHIFISHWHHDHIGGLSNVMDLTNHTKFCQVWKYPNLDEQQTIEKTGIKFDYFKDGQEFSVEGATMRVLYTPGHTVDHVVFHLLEENAIFSADCILGEGTAVFENLHDYMNSLNLILQQNPAVIYPGHGNIIGDPQQKIQDYIDHRVQRENQIVSVLKSQPEKGFDEMELVAQIYKGISAKLLLPAAVNVQHHLEKLLTEEKVVKLDGLWQFKDISKI